MKELEPSTFCMASRLSSQLSYIRARPSIATTSAARLGPVEGLVHEPVGQLVVLAAHRRVGDAADLPGQRGGLERERAERFVLHPILAAHLLDDELRVGDDLQLADARFDGPGQT